jgi:hypothetical protein
MNFVSVCRATASLLLFIFISAQSQAQDLTASHEVEAGALLTATLSPAKAPSPQTKNSTPPVVKARPPNTQIAIVSVEGAAVYQRANFDAPVIEYIRSGAKVIASLKPRVGIGGFGAFYRVKLSSGKLGWIADVDLLPQYKDDPKTKSKTDINPDFQALKDQAKMKDREPIYFENYIGGGLGLVQYTEKFDGRELSANVPLFGFRAVGPDLFLSGPPMDFSFLFSIEAPDYYTDFANGPATGFFVLSDVILPFPIVETQKSLLSFGLGPMLTYTSFQVAVRDSSFDSQEIRIGAVSSLSYVYRFSDFAVKLDGKYYFEKTDYLGFYFSFLFFRK